MGTISVEGTPVQNSGSAADPTTFPISTSGHLLLVYKDDDGNEFVIRGGPIIESDGSYGALVLEINEPIETSIDRRVVLQDGELVEVSAEFRGSTEVDFGGRNPDDVWKVLKQHAVNIDLQRFDYHPLGHNSNGTVGNLLSVVGIDIDDFLPNPVGGMLWPFAMKGKEFSFDYTLVGTAEDDVLVGAGGKQTLSGGAGDDTISGGESIDILTGDDGQDMFLGTPTDLNGDTIADLEIGDRIGISGASINPETIGSSANTVFSMLTLGFSMLEELMSLLTPSFQMAPHFDYLMKPSKMVDRSLKLLGTAKISLLWSIQQEVCGTI